MLRFMGPLFDASNNRVGFACGSLIAKGNKNRTERAPPPPHPGSPRTKSKGSRHEVLKMETNKRKLWEFEGVWEGEGRAWGDENDAEFQES
jgi:hypothetical protein